MEHLPAINTTRLAARIVLVLASFLLLFTILGLIAHLFTSWPPHLLAPDLGASFLLLLSYFFIGFFTLRTNNPLYVLLMNRSIWLGLALGTILGSILTLTEMQYHFRWVAMILMALYVPLIIWGLLTGTPPSNGDPYVYVIAIIAFFCFFAYGIIAWWFARRTSTIAFGIVAALLTAILSPLMIAIFVTARMHIPGLLDPPSEYLFPRLAGYYSLLAFSFIMIFSQIAMALVAGLLGALIGQFSNRSTKSTVVDPR